MILKNGALLITLSLFTLVPFRVKAEGWNYELQLYLMGTSISGDASVGRATGADVKVDFNDILEVLNMAAMVHFEAHHDSGWGAALDYSFMDLRDDISGPLGGVTEAKIRQGVFNVDLLYRVPAGKGSIDYLGGFRWWDNDFELRVNPAVLPGTINNKVREDWVDLFVGARWITPLSDKWNFMARADVGGFGLEANFTACLFANVRYFMTASWQLDIGYKAVWVDYETGTEGQRGHFAYDTVTHGPMVGLQYSF